VSFAYPGAVTRSLDQISFTMREGEYLVVCGESGCGKTTLLRNAKRELAPAGALEGVVRYRDLPMRTLDAQATAMEIGFVQQNPDNQIVTDFVWHELAFGLENMALPTPVIRRRVAEMASFFGIETWFRSPVHQLSGGQKQMMNLASVMAMNPQLLILDEPTSMLDPIAARTLLDAVKRINKELGVAVLLTEHRLEEVLPTADRVLVMKCGRLIANAPPTQLAKKLAGNENRHRIYFGLPTPVRIFGELSAADEIPLTIRDARTCLSDIMEGRIPVENTPEKPQIRSRSKLVLRSRELWFRYTPEGADVLRGLDISLEERDFLCLVGGNGSGKTTLLKILAGIEKPQRGRVKTARGAKIAMLSQQPQSMFTQDTLREDLLDSAEGNRNLVDRWAERLELEKFYDRHPYDLSGGEMQRAAICKLLVRGADTFLLDEPTKGLDAYMKRQLIGILRELYESGVALLVVTHDLDFAASCAKRCALLFDGTIVSEDTPHAFFSGNRFYTTTANQIAREYFPDAITCEEVVACCRESFIAKEQQ